jgi:hypothetical protein
VIRGIVGSVTWCTPAPGIFGFNRLRTGCSCVNGAGKGMQRNLVLAERRWAAWFAYSVLLLLATVGIASVLIVRSTKAFVGDDPGRGPAARYQQS